MKIGNRVRLTTRVDRYPHASIPKGETGTVARMDDYVLLSVKLDRPWPGLEEWNNELEFHHGADEENIRGVLELVVESHHPDFERVSALRCPRCKASAETEGGYSESAYPIMAVESAQHVHHVYIEADGSLTMVWDLTTDGCEDFRFLCQACGHEWAVPKHFKIGCAS